MPDFKNLAYLTLNDFSEWTQILLVIIKKTKPMINKTIILLTVILLLTNCSVDKKLVKLFKEGYTQEQSFNVQIPFEYKLGLMILKVEINKKTYDFVLDSGGINLVSKELAETLGSKGLFTKNVGGHQGSSHPMEFTKIKGLTIGGIKFEETACGIGDFSQSLELGCIELDGMIGANLMRLAVWKIDFRNQIITITNTKESLSLGAKTKKIPFYTDSTHQPYCTVKINNVEEKNVLIDLGSTGDLNLSYSNYEKIQKGLPKNKKAIGYGYPSSGYYGYVKKDSTYYLQIDRLSIGEIGLDKRVLKFSKSVAPTIGTAFFKNYDLVMNWKDKELLLSPTTDDDNQQFINKGINFNYKDGSLVIASLIIESKAEKLGIQLGDKIMQIDGKDYSNTSIEDYCDLIKKTINKEIPIKHIVINRNGEHLSFDSKNDVIFK